MKLISANIVSFGKLQNVQVPFNRGLNVFKQKNGYGKTTVANFVRAMLYGFGYNRVKGATDASHWQPWNSNDRFGGSLTVEHNGQEYRIERFFGATARSETCHVFNNKTGAEQHWKLSPGETMLGLTAESYDRSAYFPQEAVELGSNDNLDARLANLVQNSAEDYDKVQDKLRAYKKNLRYEKGVGGQIAELEQKQYDLERQRDAAARAKRRSDEIADELERIAVQKNEIVTKQAELNERSQQLQRRILQAQPTDEEKVARERLQTVTERLSAIPSEFEEDYSHCEEIFRQMEATPAPSERKPKRPAWLFGIAAALLAAVGVTMAVLSAVDLLPVALGVAAGAVAVIAGVVCVCVCAAKAKSSPVVDARQPLQNEYLNVAGKYVFADGSLNDVRRALWEKYSAYKSDLGLRDALKEMVNKPRESAESWEQKLSEVTSEKNDVEARGNALLLEQARLEEERKTLRVDTVEFEDRLLSVREQRDAAEYRYRVADVASQLLARAKENLSGSYLPRLCARTSELLGEVSATPLEVTLDRNFTVSLRENGVTKPLGEFSRGLRENTLLCFRVALSELLYDGEIPFLIVDDAFVNFDENNFVRATELLKRLSTRAQVVYFTCHDRMGKLNN